MLHIAKDVADRPCRCSCLVSCRNDRTLAIRRTRDRLVPRPQVRKRSHLGNRTAQPWRRSMRVPHGPNRDVRRSKGPKSPSSNHGQCDTSASGTRQTTGASADAAKLERLVDFLFLRLSPLHLALNATGERQRSSTTGVSDLVSIS